MKPKFNPYTYTELDTCMYCVTEEESKIFRQFLHDNGFRWSTGYSYLSNYYTQPPEVCYFFNKGTWASIKYASKFPNIKILNFTDFDWGHHIIDMDISKAAQILNM